MKVLVAHESRLIGSALACALRQAGHDAVEVEAPTAELVRTCALDGSPTVAVLSMELRRRGAGGIPLLTDLRRAGVRSLILTDPLAGSLQAECLKAGAAGFLSASAPLAGLLESVALVDRGMALVDETEGHRLAAAAERAARQARLQWEPFTWLTAKESQVLAGLMRGRRAEEIASEMFVSIATVRSHIRALLQKLNVGSQVGAVAAAFAAGWPDRRLGRRPGGARPAATGDTLVSDRFDAGPAPSPLDQLAL